ncbi:MAG: peptide deformylase [Chloroflexota bacterium]
MRFVPDPILRQQAKKFARIPANLKKFTDSMVETMHAEQGVGLAANQVGSLRKVAVIQLPDWEEPLVLVNLEIVKREGEQELEEGCLSIPGYRGLVKRSVKVRARALGLDGKVIRLKAEGLLAEALEHETDHLNGILYIDHLVSRDHLWKVSAPPEENDQDEVSDRSSSPASDSAPVLATSQAQNEPGDSNGSPPSRRLAKPPQSGRPRRSQG